MATPRKRWFRVADSLLREDLSRDQRSTFLGLLAWFNQRRQRDGHIGRRAQEAAIPPGDLLTITLSASLDEARKCLADLRERFELKIEPRGTFTFVEWPKLAEFQEWERPSAGRHSAPGSARPAPLPTPTPKPSPKPKPKKKRGRASVAPRPHEADGDEAPAVGQELLFPKPPAKPAPERLSDHDLERMREWAEEHVPWLSRGGLKADRSLETYVATVLEHFGAGTKRRSDWVKSVQKWIRKDERERLTRLGTDGAKLALRDPRAWADEFDANARAVRQQEEFAARAEAAAGPGPVRPPMDSQRIERGAHARASEAPPPASREKLGW